MQNITIKNLNDLRLGNRKGLYKKRLVSSSQYHLVCDYLEKIKYSLQDIEKELAKPADNSVLICVLAYTCWIQDSIKELKKIYQEYIDDNINVENELLSKNEDYLYALRSFVFAHPLTTNRHAKFGFDGTLRCIDIRPAGKDTALLVVKKSDKKYVDPAGYVPYDSQEVDYWLYIYNQNKYNNQSYQYVGISLKPICDIANDDVDYIYALDRYLSTIKTKRSKR